MNQAATTDALGAFRRVDFNWATHLQDVWSDSAWDVPELHSEIREEFAERLHSMRGGDRRSPLGWFVIGSGGVGKTHLIGAMRQEAARQQVGFVLVDMTDVRDFWDVVLQGYLDSLQSAYGEGTFQYQTLLHQFISRVGREDEAARNLRVLARRKSRELSDDVKQIVGALRMKHPKEAIKYQDVVRAVICLNSEDMEIAASGYGWLQGQELEEEMRTALGFSRRHEEPIEIVRALSWFMSLSGPTVVAFDQLDPIVQQVRHQTHVVGDGTSEEEGTARSIIEQIGGGLGAMRDVTTSTLTVVSCVEPTLDLLNDLVLSTYLDRFEPPRRLQRPASSEVYRRLIRERLAPACRANSFQPPYETWPFRPEAIDELKNESAREVLKLCEQHRKACLQTGNATELASFQKQGETPAQSAKPAPESGGLARLDRLFQKYREQADPDSLLEEKHEDERLAPLYRTAFDCLIRENEECFSEHVEPMVEQEFSGGKTTKPLHARLRIVDHSQDSREDHYCVRALQRRHHSAYRARLKAAMTQSGIDKALKFRHLVIVRSFDFPGGAQTEELTRKFKQAGGRFHVPSEEELRTLDALHRLIEERDPQLTDWLQARRPATSLGLGDALALGSRLQTETPPEPPGPQPGDPRPKESQREAGQVAPTDECSAGSSGSPSTASPAQHPSPAERSEPVRPPSTPVPAVSGDAASLPFGRKMMGMGTLGDVVSLPLTALTKHTIILGGSGSGKSVTVRRVVEEAALAGIPSIVVDCAQDMCCFDRSWTEPPAGWSDGDPQRAEAFKQRVEQVVWTPGSMSSGNPLSLRPLPDFTPVRDDPEELNDAVTMACDGLKQIVASGSSQKSRNCYGILMHSLKYFATHFPSEGLDGYIALLSDLPKEAELGIGNERKLAQEMASSLKVERTTNPLLTNSGSPLDPLVLFGDDRRRETVRISVISLVKLKGQNAAHSFLNQLAMELFSWIKQNPSPPDGPPWAGCSELPLRCDRHDGAVAPHKPREGRPLRGLLVIDEARDFVPSQKSTECKESLMRLAAQARKYRLGLVFATQHPKDIETKIVGNCATHLYGLNNAPASLATLQDLMAQKGGTGDDIPRLKAGQFYIHNADAGHGAPIKIQVPMSLSWSPANPLQEAEIMQRAATGGWSGASAPASSAARSGSSPQTP